MFYLIFAVVFSIFKLQAQVCEQPVLNLCGTFGELSSKKELEDILRELFKDGEKAPVSFVNSCTPMPDSKAIVIAFEGTSHFDKTFNYAFNRLLQCYGGKLPADVQALYKLASAIYEDELKRKPLWSALSAGVLSETIKARPARKMDWYSFPSEELPSMVDVKNYMTLERFKEIIKDLSNPVPQGAIDAHICLNKYMAAAAGMGLKPKVIVVGYSSGGRAAVKFSELLKGEHKLDLVVTVDPIIEAQVAIKEVLADKSEAALMLSGQQVKDAHLKSKSRPDELYKVSNILRHVNLYQTSDKKGLKMGPDIINFGIHGNPVAAADQNIQVHGLSEASHGEIGYSKEVLEVFRTETENLLNAP